MWHHMTLILTHLKKKKKKTLANPQMWSASLASRRFCVEDRNMLHQRPKKLSKKTHRTRTGLCRQQEDFVQSSSSTCPCHYPRHVLVEVPRNKATLSNTATIWPRSRKLLHTPVSLVTDPPGTCFANSFTSF